MIISYEWGRNAEFLSPAEKKFCVVQNPFIAQPKPKTYQIVNATPWN